MYKKIAIIFIALCVTISSTLIIANSKTKNNKDFYFLCNSKTTTKAQAVNEAIIARNRAGAGYIIKNNNTYSVALIAYPEKKVAEEKTKSIENSFVEKISINMDKDKITVDITNLACNIYDLAMEFDKGEININEVVCSLENMKLKFLMKHREDDEKTHKVIIALDKAIYSNKADMSFKLKYTEVELLLIAKSK